MAKKKQAYLGFSDEEVRRMETNFFTLRFGGNFLSQNNSFLFTQKEANRLYEDTLKDLLDIVDDGSDKDRSHALYLISDLSIQPMRLH